MKMQLVLLAAVLAVCSFAASAVEGRWGERITSLSVYNDAPMPIHVDVERGRGIIYVGPSARFGDSVLVTPNSNFALRIPEGHWVVYGDGQSNIDFRAHHGGDYSLRLTPVMEGHHRLAIAGVLSDSHLGQRSDILIRNVPNAGAYVPPPGNPWMVDPAHSPVYGDDPLYGQYTGSGAEVGSQLAHAVNNALGQLLHINPNPPPPPPYVYAPPPPPPPPYHHGYQGW